MKPVIQNAIKMVLVLFPSLLFAQQGILTAGFQVKPIFSNSYFGTGPQKFESGNTSAIVKQASGYCAGMVIRRGFTNTISAETGINYVRRNYKIQITDTGYSHTGKYKFIGYEIPLSLLVFIQLSEKLYTDVSLGNSFDFYPSDIETQTEYYYNYGVRRAWLSNALIANIGFEYRTESSGSFYLGASYHRPYSYIYQSQVTFIDKPFYPVFKNKISGNYLTIDIRYFFSETPLKKQEKKEIE